jgi:hypothetical protein
MKVAAVVLVLAAVAYVAIDEIADLTQTRPESHPADASTRIVLDVATRRASTSELAAVGALVAACSLTTTSEVVEGPRRVDAGYEVILEPALGDHGRRRLTGCLEDAIIDRVLGEVIEVETVRAP